MRSIRNIDDLPAGSPLLADDLTEFHAARLLLLLGECGVNGRIEGLTKLAKLDFFVRYPSFFEQASQHLGKNDTSETHSVESPMVRFHYGPWDQRYYHVLSFLEARRLISIDREGNTFRFSLTKEGTDARKALASLPEFGPLVDQMKQVKHRFGKWSGNRLKDLIYRVFAEEVAERPLGEVIKQ